MTYDWVKWITKSGSLGKTHAIRDGAGITACGKFLGKDVPRYKSEKNKCEFCERVLIRSDDESRKKAITKETLKEKITHEDAKHAMEKFIAKGGEIKKFPMSPNAKRLMEIRGGNSMWTLADLEEHWS